jgi:hypothetical protein
MQRDKSDEQFEKAQLSRVLTRQESGETGANVTAKRSRHPEKQFSQMCATDEGMQIESSTEQYENAECSIHKSFETAPNVTVERALHSEKQWY